MKRKDVFNFLRNKNRSIYCLQDVHFTKQMENYIQTEWGYSCYFSSFTTQARGVSIMFKNNFEFKIKGVERDENGNYLALSIWTPSLNFTLINIYGPNTDTPDFYDRIDQAIIKFDNPHHVICGDWNLILEPLKDAFNYLHINNPRARQRVLELIETHDLIDIWRENHPHERRYTWRQPNPLKQARLDFFLVSPGIAGITKATSIEPGYKTDHSVIELEIQTGDIKKVKVFGNLIIPCCMRRNTQKR